MITKVNNISSSYLLKYLINVVYEKKLIKLRKRVNELFFNHHFSKSMIAKKKKLSRNIVIKWTKSRNQDFSQDSRGWKKGKRRKWTKQDERRIKEIFNTLG
jgi:transposase